MICAKIFAVRCEPLVQPKIIPPNRRNQVTKPLQQAIQTICKNFWSVDTFPVFQWKIKVLNLLLCSISRYCDCSTINCNVNTLILYNIHLDICTSYVTSIYRDTALLKGLQWGHDPLDEIGNTKMTHWGPPSDTWKIPCFLLSPPVSFWIRYWVYTRWANSWETQTATLCLSLAEDSCGS